MPLTFSGKRETSEQFSNLLEAYDSDKGGIVVASSEAIADHGLDTVHRRASEKYDAGDFMDENGRVTDFTSDL